MPEEKMIREFEVIIIGAGPAGLVAALYVARSVRGCIIIDKLGPGGQVVITDIVENYPGFQKISGQGLAQELIDQVKAYDVPIEIKEVQRIVDEEEYKIVVADGAEYIGKTVIIATGTKPKKLMAPGGQEFGGKGISYCALCDAPFLKIIPLRL